MPSDNANPAGDQPSADDQTKASDTAPPAADATFEYSDASEESGGPTVVSDGPLVAPEGAYAGLRPVDLGKALIGQKIDSVLLERFVGGGGMGAVFRGQDVALQRTVAVKVLATHNPSGGNVARRFEVEARSAARLDHPNIARIFHIGEDHGLQYIVFEFIDGMNLRDLVSGRGPQPVPAVLSYAVQMADALTHAWRRQVVHRDIKPSNILITPRGQAKLVDMGLARMHQMDQQENDLTATGATLGTFDYIAPEQARDPRLADIRSDIYSLGCTLFYALTGKPPFAEGTALQKLLRHQGDAPPSIREERPDVPRPLARVIEKMLAKQPAARYQDPLELLKTLVGLAEPMGITVPAAALLAGPTSPRGRAWRTHAPWAAAVALLVAYGVFVLQGSSRPPAESPFAPLRLPAATEAGPAPGEQELELRDAIPTAPEPDSRRG
ncbi:MAG: serine/threonine-protein kinase [Planctomycetota bacterium]